MFSTLFTTLVVLILMFVAAGILAIRRQEKKRRYTVAFRNTFGTIPPTKGASLKELELLRAKARKQIEDLFRRAEAIRNDIQEATDVDNVRMLHKMESGLNEEAADIFALAVRFGVVEPKSTIFDLVKPD